MDVVWQTAARWLERRLPAPREARWRARMLLGFVALRTVVSGIVLAACLILGAGLDAVLLSAALVGAGLLHLAVMLRLRWWERAARADTLLLVGLICAAHLMDPGPQAGLVGASAFAVVATAALVSRQAGAGAALLLAGVILADGWRPHTTGLPPGVVQADLYVAAMMVVGTSGLMWVLRYSQVVSFAELEQARLAAESGSRAKDTFLATMSHEIRTPLHGILGLAQVLQDTRLDADQHALVSTVHASGVALQRILDDVLDFSRLEAGLLVLDTQPFSPAALIREVTALFDAQASTHGLRLRGVAAASLPEAVSGDGFRLRQVLLNLIGNAVKFTPRGSVTLTAAAGEGDAVVFTVEDTGIGIPADRMAALFEPFVQAEDSTTRRFGGSGLGLSICRRLVEGMGGTLSVESVVGQGTCFRVSLPLPPAALDTADAGAAAVPRALSGRVLVAEDNAINQVVAERLLGGWGLSVTVVSDGQAAVEAAKASEYDLILMDQFMPKLDGLAATRAIRAWGGRLAEVPILGFTASVSAAERAACRRAGMDHIIAKPVDKAALLEAVERHLGAQRPR